jgi:hypothetical protein
MKHDFDVRELVELHRSAPPRQACINDSEQIIVSCMILRRSSLA